jgi:uncharacterized membrane protein
MTDENVQPINFKQAGAFVLRIAVVLGVVAACIAIPILIPFVLLGLAKKGRIQNASRREEGSAPTDKPEI